VWTSYVEQIVCGQVVYGQVVWNKLGVDKLYVTKGSLGYLSSMYFSTSLVLEEVAAPFPEIER